MMDANKARELMVASREKLMSKELSEIELKINNECRSGYDKLIIKGKISSYTQEKLRQLGYKVNTTDDQREGTWTTISWEAPKRAEYV